MNIKERAEKLYSASARCATTLIRDLEGVALNGHVHGKIAAIAAVGSVVVHGMHVVDELVHDVLLSADTELEHKELLLELLKKLQIKVSVDGETN